MTRYLTIRQAAEALNVSDDTIRRMLPQLGAVDMTGGGKKRLIRIPERALEAYLNGCTIRSPIPARRKPAPTEWHIERRRA